ncbi:copper chaperone PCu(A)C [Microbacterium excoecariae]|uniref:copper chaperone PCu(A)C n=1 Tax=Microbacterium excoecariae TaxID=2715210 RepID=UPI00140D0512|nr:copper chaperone PCu(A)C [Microbacterium excoecariae]NHI15600.1 copper chaperone PCu(A)C [Microbacterium excoecariae]
MHTTTTAHRFGRTAFGLVLLTGAAALAGCAAGGSADQAADETAAEAVTIEDAWVKAADSGMSAAFGVLTNDSSADVTVVSAETEASTMIELHETVESETGETIMREIDGGFVVPADATYALEPGGSHLMLMELTDPLEAGEEVEFTLTFGDGSTATFEAPVKDYSGANENYGGASDMDMGESDMDMDH